MQVFVLNLCIGVKETSVRGRQGLGIGETASLGDSVVTNQPKTKADGVCAIGVRWMFKIIWMKLNVFGI